MLFFNLWKKNGYIWEDGIHNEVGFCCALLCTHYNDVMMGVMASQITSLTIVYSTVYSGADQRTHQSSVSLAFVRRIHWWPVNSPHKWPVTRKCFHLMMSSWPIPLYWSLTRALDCVKRSNTQCITASRIPGHQSTSMATILLYPSRTDQGRDTIYQLIHVSKSFVSSVMFS